jgi:hypothetical protein
MRKALIGALVVAGAAALSSEKGARAVAWPRRKLQLELMVTQYIDSCGGPIFRRDARTQARELILDGPYNPFSSAPEGA